MVPVRCKMCQVQSHPSGFYALIQGASRFLFLLLFYLFFSVYKLIETGRIEARHGQKRLP